MTIELTVKHHHLQSQSNLCVAEAHVGGGQLVLGGVLDCLALQFHRFFVLLGIEVAAAQPHKIVGIILARSLLDFRLVTEPVHGEEIDLACVVGASKLLERESRVLQALFIISHTKVKSTSHKPQSCQ